MDTILITGGAGFVGSHFARLAADAGRGSSASAGNRSGPISKRLSRTRCAHGPAGCDPPRPSVVIVPAWAPPNRHGRIDGTGAPAVRGALKQ